MSMEHLEKVSRAMADDYGVKVVFKGGEAYTDHKTIVLPELPKGEVTERDQDRIRGYCDHEVAHVTHSEDINKMPYFRAADPQTQALTAIVEDIRCENLHSKKYAGARVNMQKLAQTLIPEMDMAHPFAKLMIEGRRQVCDYKFSHPDESKQLKSKFGNDIFDRLAACKTSKDSFDLANYIMNLPDRDVPPEEEEQDGEGEGGEGEGEGESEKKQGGGSGEGEGDEDGEGEGEGEGDGEGDEGEGKGKPGKGSDKEGEGRSDGPKDQEREGNSKGRGSGVGSVKAIDSKLKPFKDPIKGVAEDMSKKHNDALKAGQYMPYSTSSDKFKVMSEGGANSLTNYQDLVRKLGTFSSVKARIKSMFTTRISRRWQSGKEEGHINNRVLAGVVADRRDLFKKREVCDDVDTAITFLVDCSGSMNSSGKIETAMATVAMFCETLNTTKVKFEILGFTTGDHISMTSAERNKNYARIEELVTYVWKEFSEPVSAKTRKRVGNWRSLSMANNCDGESLMVAFRRLMQRKEQRKIMFVLSDGQPCCAAGSHLGDRYLKEVCGNIEKKSPVELIGIGYMNRSVKNFYKNTIMVDNPVTLPGIMLKELKRILKVA